MAGTDLEPPAQRATLRDIAADAGVSIATVSRVVNDDPHVAPGTREAVLGAIERRNFSARRRRRRVPGAAASNLVAVRCPYALTDYFGIILAAIARSLHRHGKRPVLSVEAAEGDEPSLARLLSPEDTEGTILVLPPEPPAALAELRATGRPFVVIDPRTAPPADVAAVSAAHLAGSRAATEHLLGLGHRRIAAIAGPLDWLATDGRLVGYRAALAAAGHLASDELIRVGGEPTTDHGRDAARALLDLAAPPTAVVAFNDKMAIGALQAAHERGLRVPEQLSVIGFDDLDLSRLVVPRLTTVHQPLEEMARIGVDLLMRLIGGQEIDTLHLELATRLVIRDSTAPPA
jgi:LacI family transcriptional regulator, galactose operon repressor